jgi:hypothetical protein
MIQPGLGPTNTKPEKFSEFLSDFKIAEIANQYIQLSSDKTF